MTDYRDRHPEGDEVGRAVLLPGRGYTPDKPVLAAVSDVLLARGWAVREIWWTVPEGLRPRDAGRWVDDQARTAAEGWSDRPLLVGKSLGTFASPYAAKHGLEAVWLTPLLGERSIVKGIRRNRARQLLVGGTADEAWVPQVADRLPGELLELPGADHALVVPGDEQRSAAYRDRLRAAVTAWLPS
jgi:hypothetical protein